MKWRCRRGMRELDTLLTRWLDQHWASAGEDLQGSFRELLDAEDDQLWNWLLGRSRPESRSLCMIVDDIRGTAVSRD
nr:succinate dehydrogenase assembly factor 2 [Wenzhouxiangella limi]